MHLGKPGNIPSISWWPKPSRKGLNYQTPHEVFGKKHLGLLLFEFNEHCTQCKKKASVFQSVVFFKKEIEEILHGNGLRVFIFIMQADNIDKNDKKRKPRRVVKKKQHLILRKKGEECMNFQGFIFSNQIWSTQKTECGFSGWKATKMGVLP